MARLPTLQPSCSRRGAARDMPRVRAVARRECRRSHHPTRSTGGTLTDENTSLEWRALVCRPTLAVEAHSPMVYMGRRVGARERRGLVPAHSKRDGRSSLDVADADQPRGASRDDPPALVPGPHRVGPPRGRSARTPRLHLARRDAKQRPPLALGSVGRELAHRCRCSSRARSTGGTEWLTIAPAWRSAFSSRGRG
jgi:hypothetical protein